MFLKSISISALVILSLTPGAMAQLSPGKLAEPHKHIDHLDDCVKCHALGKNVSAQLCLQCHGILKKRIDQKKGLHTNKEFENCVLCHVDHQGRNYELVFWKEGKDNFEHQKTGYKLLGKHTELKCKECHQSKNITAKKLFVDNKKDLNRTLLGLNKKCLTCHFDEHRRQVKQSCLDCHTMKGWKPASKFNHNRARFRLTGKHVKVPCRKCHPIVRDRKNKQDPSYMKFTGIRFNTCTGCHEDIHKNKFGQNCTKCHTTRSWTNIKRNNFDHDATRYPLRGKHATLHCEQCHKPNRSITDVKFKFCTDCHSDYHRGQFIRRRRKGACEECHTVQGFTPSKFTLKMHGQTKYPLTGSHLAVPCIACHKKTVVSGKDETIKFKFHSTRCQVCHEDYHRGELKKYVSRSGCEYCHSTTDWGRITFDHEQSEFALQGRHGKIACRDCHKPAKRGFNRGRLKLIGLTKECQSCHRDNHAGQFYEQKIFAKINRKFTRCERCHTSENWRADKFIHNRDAAFKLDGEHRYVPCADCHKKTKIAGKVVVRYKPLNGECRSCHEQKPRKLKR